MLVTLLVHYVFTSYVLFRRALKKEHMKAILYIISVCLFIGFCPNNVLFFSRSLFTTMVIAVILEVSFVLSAVNILSWFVCV